MNLDFFRPSVGSYRYAFVTFAIGAALIVGSGLAGWLLPGFTLAVIWIIGRRIVEVSR